MKASKLLILVTLTSLSFVSCAEQGGPMTKSSAGTLLGAVGGAMLGSQVGKGKGNIAAIAIGTLAGAAIGTSIGASLDNVDKQYMASTNQRAFEVARTGQVMEWRNPDSGHHGTITPTATYQAPHGQYCREYTQTVSVGGKTEKAYGKACRQPDGAWEIVN
jgi:surface antigen